MKKLSLAIAISCFIAQTAYADIWGHLSRRHGTGLLFEFSANHIINGKLSNHLTTQANPSENGNYQYDFRGQRYDFRMGVMIGRFVIGPEVSFGDNKYDFSAPDGSQSSGRMTSKTQGGFIMWRGDKFIPWIGINLGGKAQLKKQGITLDDPAGLNVGLGYRITNWLILNLEARKRTYETYESTGTPLAIPANGNEEFDASEVSVGLTLSWETNKKISRSRRRR